MSWHPGSAGSGSYEHYEYDYENADSSAWADHADYYDSSQSYQETAYEDAGTSAQDAQHQLYWSHTKSPSTHSSTPSGTPSGPYMAEGAVYRPQRPARKVSIGGSVTHSDAPDVQVLTKDVHIEEPQVEFKVMQCGQHDGVGEMELEVCVEAQTLQIEQLLGAKADLMKEVERLMAINIQKDQDMSQLQGQLDALKSKLAGALADLQAAEEREAQLKRRGRQDEAELTDLKRELEARDRKIANLQQQVDRDDDEMGRLRQQLRDRDAEVADLQDRLKAALDKNGKLTAENATLQARQASLHDDLRAAADETAALKAMVAALKEELENYKKMMDNLTGGKSDLERRLAELARTHAEKLKHMALMSRDLEEIKLAVSRLMKCNNGIAFHVAQRKATLLKEDGAGNKTQWIVMGGTEGGADLKDHFVVALRKEVTRLEELERYEKGYTKLREDEWKEKVENEQLLWIKEEAYYRKYLQMNEQDVFQIIFSMAHRERWSITKYLLGKKALRDSVLGLEPGLDRTASGSWDFPDYPSFGAYSPPPHLLPAARSLSPASPSFGAYSPPPPALRAQSPGRRPDSPARPLPGGIFVQPGTPIRGMPPPAPSPGVSPVARPRGAPGPPGSPDSALFHSAGPPRGPPAPRGPDHLGPRGPNPIPPMRESPRPPVKAGPPRGLAQPASPAPEFRIPPIPRPSQSAAPPASPQPPR